MKNKHYSLLKFAIFIWKIHQAFSRDNSRRMHRAEFVPARKGGRHLRDHLGMTYYLSKRREKKSYYFCTEKKTLSCGATAVVDNTTDMIIKISGEHAHNSNLMHHNIRDLEEQAVRKAADNHNAPRLSWVTSPTPLPPQQLNYLASTYTSLIIYIYVL